MAGPETPRMPGGGGPGIAYYMFFFMGIATLVIVTGLLAASFWLARPVNLVPATNHLADVLEQTLRDNYVPPENIERAAPVEEATDRDGIPTRWTTHAFTVTLPGRLNRDGFKTRLRKDMSAHFVKLVENVDEPESDRARLALYLDDLAFAEITLVPAATGQADMPRSDLRQQSDHVTDQVARALEALELTPPPVREEAEERADPEALWRYTRFAVTLPPGMTLGALKEQIEIRDTLPGVSVRAAPRGETDIDILIRIAGKPCVGLACTLTPETAPDPEEPEPVSGPADDVITGSDPEEMPPSDAPASREETAEYLAIPEDDRTAPAAPALEPEPPGPRGESPDPSRARIAIIIDDGGYNNGQADRFLALDNRLTLAILPNTPHGTEMAERGAALGFEIMLHMPMETESGSETAVPGTLFTAMGREEILALTRKALDQVPHAAGVNNHTGSKFTANREKMGYCLEVVAEHGLFFVDSVTKHTSVAYDVAAAAGVPAGRRDIFLDNDGDEARIREQFEILIDRARERGQAIGIGHFQSPATAAVLAAEIPRLAGENIDLVHVSELVQ